MSTPRRPDYSDPDLAATSPRGKLLLPPVIRSAMSRFVARLFKGSARRYSAVLLVWIILLIIFRTHLGSYSIALPSGLLECAPSWQHAGIVRPTKPDREVVSQSWLQLQKVFDAHPPQPASLPYKLWDVNNDQANWELIKSWTQISEQDANATRAVHEHLLKNLPEYPLKWYSRRGIITLAGGKWSEYAATGLGVLREIGSSLPVEVWMKDKNDVKEGWCQGLEKEGMACRLLSDYMDVSKVKHGYQFKVYTMLFSSFEEFLFLDADNIAVSNPDAVFDSEVYLKNGAVLWPDYWKNPASPWTPYITGASDNAAQTWNEELTVESGQILWNKHRHWSSLCLAAYYNYYGPQYYWTLISQGHSGWGDKDTFPTALQALGEPFYKVPHAVKTAFVTGTSQGIAMVQASPTNEKAFEPMFLHANIYKWSIMDYLCTGCYPTADDPNRGYSENPSAMISPHLQAGRRVLAKLEDLSLDPEPLIWKSMERTACRSVWKEDGLCRRTRDFMSKAFGFKFKIGKVAATLGLEAEPCLEIARGASYSS